MKIEKLILFLISIIIGSTYLSDSLDAISCKGYQDDLQAASGQSLLTIKSSQNESNNSSYYSNSLKLALDQYQEDYQASTRTLDNYVKKNITEAEALVNTTSILILNSLTLENVRKLDPPKNYSNYHGNVLKALTDFQYYLWNLAKFYETRKGDYVLEARNFYNSSHSYYAKALNDSKAKH